MHSISVITHSPNTVHWNDFAAYLSFLAKGAYHRYVTDAKMVNMPRNRIQMVGPIDLNL